MGTAYCSYRSLSVVQLSSKPWYHPRCNAFPWFNLSDYKAHHTSPGSVILGWAQLGECYEPFIVAIKSSRGIADIDITCRVPLDPNSTDSRVIAPASGASTMLTKS